MLPHCLGDFTPHLPPLMAAEPGCTRELGPCRDAMLGGDMSWGTLPPDQLSKERIQQGEYEIHHHETIQVLPHTCLPALGRQSSVA